MASLRARALALLGLAAIALALYLPFLLGPDGRVASNPIGDVANYFVFVRAFWADHVLAGELPLWNPHLFAGVPFVGAFQTAAFYPPNVLYLALPLSTAINADLMLHVFWIGATTFVWLAGWRLHPLAAAFGAGAIMLSGPTFLRALAGQLSVLGTLAWAPLVLWTVDRVVAGGRLRPLLVGVFATAMMLLAGHPPTAYMCALVTGAYALASLRRARPPARALAWLSPLAVAPALMAAVQLLPGLDVAREAIRAGGMSFDFATSFSFPPENLITAVLPEALGDADRCRRSYFGRWFHWDASAFVGVVVLVTAIHGAIVDRGFLRRFALFAVPVLVVLALGRYTPVYEPLFDVVPGFDRFRAPSKLMFHAALFTAALAAVGTNRLLEDRARPRAALGAALLILAGLLALFVGLALTDPGDAGSPVAWLAAANAERSFSVAELERWQTTLSGQVVGGLVITAVALVVLLQRPRRRAAVFVLCALAAVELGLFAWDSRGGAWIDAQYRRRPNVAETFGLAGSSRVLLLERTSNIAVAERGFDVWGNESVVLRRYAELVAATQGRTVEEMNNIGGEPPDAFHPLFSMLRGRFSVRPSGDVVEHADPLPRLVLVDDYRVAPGLDRALAETLRADFDPRRMVVLESEPSPRPVRAAGAPPGTTALLAESSDHLLVRVQLERPAILLVTDAYARGWRALCEADGAHPLLPANGALRAVPLPAGEHTLRLEYAPASWGIGWRISAGAWAVYLVALGIGLVRGRR